MQLCAYHERRYLGLKGMANYALKINMVFELSLFHCFFLFSLLQNTVFLQKNIFALQIKTLKFFSVFSLFQCCCGNTENTAGGEKVEARPTEKD